MQILSAFPERPAAARSSTSFAICCWSPSLNLLSALGVGRATGADGEGEDGREEELCDACVHDRSRS